MEGLPLVGEVVPMFVDRGCHVGSAMDPHRPELLLSLPSSSSVVLTRLSGPRSKLTTSQKIW
jgi:hypothetical protein